MPSNCFAMTTGAGVCVQFDISDLNRAAEGGGGGPPHDGRVASLSGIPSKVLCK